MEATYTTRAGDAWDLIAYRVYGDLLLTVQREDPLPPFTPVPLALEGETSLPEAGWALTCRRAVTPAEAPRGGNHFFLDPARLSGPLVLRPRQTGDRLALPGRGEKTVKKLLIDGKVPRRLRDRVPVLADGAGALVLFKTLLAVYLRELGEEIPNQEGILDVDQAPDPQEWEDAYARYTRRRVRLASSR